jgi:uncharacterized membrane protein
MSDEANKSDLSQPGAGRGGRWRYLLIGSLALNLFLAGVLGVWAMRPYFHRQPPPPQPGTVSERIANRLPEVDRPVLRQAFAKRQGEINRLFEESRKAQQESRAALRANPFDAAAFDAAAERNRATRNALQDAVHAAMREAAMGMSAEGRERLMPRRRPPSEENRRRQGS